MVKRLFAMLFACAVISACAFAGDQDFELVNNTGVVIDKLFVSPTGAGKWGEDVLGKDQLEDDQSVEIKFHPSEEAEYWDLKIVDTEGNEVVWKKLKLTQIAKITISIENGQPVATTE